MKPAPRPYKSPGAAVESLYRGNGVFLEIDGVKILRFAGHWPGLETFLTEIAKGENYPMQLNGRKKEKKS